MCYEQSKVTFRIKHTRTLYKCLYMYNADLPNFSRVHIFVTYTYMYNSKFVINMLNLCRNKYIGIDQMI